MKGSCIGVARALWGEAILEALSLIRLDYGLGAMDLLSPRQSYVRLTVLLIAESSNHIEESLRDLMIPS